MTAADLDLTTILNALRERAAEQSRDGPAGAAANGIAFTAYGWLGDNIGAFVADTADTSPQADWRDDPAADERWNAGVDYAQQKLCKVLGINPVEVNWDAATETVDGDIEAVTGNILRLAYGEDGVPCVWRPIAEAEREIATILELGEMTIRNSLPIWARDSDGRVYQAVWTDHRQGYWWDIEGESPADPIEFYPHPLEARA